MRIFNQIVSSHRHLIRAGAVALLGCLLVIEGKAFILGGEDMNQYDSWFDFLCKNPDRASAYLQKGPRYLAKGHDDTNPLALFFRVSESGLFYAAQIVKVCGNMTEQCSLGAASLVERDPSVYEEIAFTGTMMRGCCS